MMGSSRSLIIMALTLFALSLTSAQEELENGKFRRLVRRKKQLMDLESQESRNIVRPSKPEDDLLEGRAVRPVKVKRRKIINGRPQKKVVKNSMIPKTSNKNHHQPCKKCFWTCSSKTKWCKTIFVVVHNCVVQERCMYVSDRCQWNLLFCKRLWGPGRNKIRNLCKWIRSVLSFLLNLWRGNYYQWNILPKYWIPIHLWQCWFMSTNSE